MRTEKEIGEIIRKLRGNQSLRDFAKKCDISHTTIDNLEKGIDHRTGKPTQVKVTTLQKIADACLVPLSYITDEADDTSEQNAKIAVFGGDVEVTDEMWQDILSYAEFIKTKYK